MTFLMDASPDRLDETPTKGTRTNCSSNAKRLFSW